MRYVIAYVPYFREPEKIELVFCDTERDLVRVIVEDIGCAPVEYYDGDFYNDEGYAVRFPLKDCLAYLKENFVGDGSYGAVMLTVTKGTTVLFQG